ncbi:hypothetical protein J14TS2_37750 [Bacillus sp. J14TS2]|uniref:DUF6323 family protein n=1 Tax=Bacillus sp. J14TS2 TaxID=2807188 RepID=UPI001B24123D|nr:DUF6323 family protein [Bacillus sp. J14TS2]GIN73300.1 hypothetical protein J14TS2_37750 [Bacillus sp. J14TS2]
MFSPKMLYALNSSMLDKYTDEIVEVNQKTKEFGLELTRDEIKNIIVARNQVLHSYGRVELSVDVTKELAAVFCASPHVDNKNYVSTLYELQEIFYYLKNETEDKIGDSPLIAVMKNYFDDVCNGSLELLKSKLEEFAERFRNESSFRKSFLERDER